MDIEALIEALSDTQAYPWLDPATPVEVIQTHISVVFLVGREVIKIHKPVDFGFLDFTSLTARRTDCEAEVAVNATLAPGVYRGVVGIYRDEGGRVFVTREPAEAPTEAIEWAVWMRRLPDSANFASLLARGQLGRPQLWGLAASLVAFYRDGQADAASHPELARLGDVETVAGNMRENFAQLDAIVDAAREFRQPEPLDRDLIERLRLATESTFARVKGRIHARFEAGQTRDTHGDLRLEHVYSLGHTLAEDREFVSEELLEARGRRELLIIHRIEFTPRFRWSDPIADVAFLAMDLRARGAWQLARCFVDDFATASEDPDVAKLLPFYSGYRATVRAKVAAMASTEAELGREAQAAARTEAAARARLALVELSRPRERPCLILVAGLPGTGKSLLARGLRETGEFTWIRADEVRKRLAGLNPFSPHASEVDQGLYTSDWSEKTYAACLSRAADVCCAGGRAMIDATFVDAARREAFVHAAVAWGVPVLMLVAHAPRELIRERLAARKGDPSDATFTVYEALAKRWAPIDPLLCPHAQVDASGTPREMLSDATRALSRAELL